ncbi:MAG: fatty acyl-AMP ligase [Myxococcota bacterium]|nr:fatty acyl-AMP ligase [Myxococcota bacterium]
MPEYQTLNQALDDLGPQQDATLRFLDRRERATEIPWSQMREQALQVAGQLMALGVEHGERVILVFATEPDFFRAFFGCTLAGAVPCPVYPPVRLGRMEHYHAKTARMVALSGARLILAGDKVKKVLGGVVERARPTLGCLQLSELPKAAPDRREVTPDDLAMLQFSSGTTVDPKPVALTHGAVSAQTNALLHHLLQDAKDVPQAGVSWLPLYHDMGLIGCVFPSLFHPGDLTLMGPEVFIARPAMWLRALSKYGGVISPAPNFAYGLCLDRIKDEQLEGVDLSGWRVALNGAEPVAPQVLRDFQDRFAKWGFQPESLSPVYGLSEASLAVTFSDLGTPFRATRFDPHALAEGRAVEDSEGQEIVSVGTPIRGFQVQIRDADHQHLPDGRLGTVWCTGPSLLREYLGNPEATARALVDGWLDTGDQGFIHDGELYLSGRIKDLLILNGRNHAPHPVEQAVDGLPGVRTGCAAAVSYRDESAASEQLVLFVEHGSEASPAQISGMAEACAEAVLVGTGLVCAQVLVLPPGTLPRTSSGKIRRSEALRQHLAGELVPPDKVHLLRVAGILARSALGFWRAR